MDWKTTVLGTYAGLSIIKELWELFSDKPLITGAFDLATFLSRYWLLVVSVPIFLLIVLPPIIERFRELEPIFNKHFKNDTLVIDGKSYMGCTFENCKLSYDGGKFIIAESHKNGSVGFTSNNDVVVRTIILLKSMGLLEENFAKRIQRVPKNK